MCTTVSCYNPHANNFKWPIRILINTTLCNTTRQGLHNSMECVSVHDRRQFKPTSFSLPKQLACRPVRPWATLFQPRQTQYKIKRQRQDLYRYQPSPRAYLQHSSCTSVAFHYRTVRQSYLSLLLLVYPPAQLGTQRTAHEVERSTAVN